MYMFTMVHGRVYISHHGYLLPPNPTLTSVVNPSNWIYDDDIDRMSDEEAPQGKAGGVGGDGGDVGDSGANNVRGLDVLGSFGVVPLEEKMCTPSD